MAQTGMEHMNPGSNLDTSRVTGTFLRADPEDPEDPLETLLFGYVTNSLFLNLQLLQTWLRLTP
jgi:hypothetical protein